MSIRCGFTPATPGACAFDAQPGISAPAPSAASPVRNLRRCVSDLPAYRPSMLPAQLALLFISVAYFMVFLPGGNDRVILRKVSPASNARRHGEKPFSDSVIIWHVHVCGWHYLISQASQPGKVRGSSLRRHIVGCPRTTTHVPRTT